MYALMPKSKRQLGAAPERPPIPLATSHDVARVVGVSQPTVSRALRDDPRLTEETKNRVLVAAQALGYVPSQRGRSLATRSSGQIGVVVSDLRNPFYLEVLDELHDALRASGFRMLVVTPDADNELPLSQLVDGSLDGVVLTTTLLDSMLPTELARRGFPFVLLNREVDDSPGDACVVDNLNGGELAARELLTLGHTEIAAIFGPNTTSTGRDREAGFRAVLREAAVELRSRRWQRRPFDFASGYEATTELIESHPTALFCANDILALGAFNALIGRGVHMPDDITLIGFDDVLLASWEAFQLTTVSQNTTEMARSAVGLLLSRIGTKSASPLPPRRLLLEPSLVRRSTHGPPRQADGLIPQTTEASNQSQRSGTNLDR